MLANLWAIANCGYLNVMRNKVEIRNLMNSILIKKSDHILLRLWVQENPRLMKENLNGSKVNRDI